MLHFAIWKKLLIAAVCATGIFMAFFYNLTLGLDLQGGSYLLLEVEQESLIEGQLKKTPSGRERRVDGMVQRVMGDIRGKLRPARIGYSGMRAKGKVITLKIRKPEQVEQAVRELRTLIEPIDQGVFATGNNAVTLDVREAGGTVTLEITDEAVEDRIERAIQQSLEVVRSRIDPDGTTEPIIQRQGLNRILVQVPGLDDPERLKGILGSTAKLSFQLLCRQQPQGDIRQFRAEPGCEVLPENTVDGAEPTIFYAVHTSSNRRVDGEDLEDAQAAFDQQTSEPIVTFRLNTRGAKRFGLLTQRNVGQPFAINLDGKVMSAPVIREPILGGTGQISGQFTVSQTNDLAVVLRSGALPAKLVIVEERSVGPSLGADSVAAGQVAAIIGLTGVILFILISYGVFGIFANLALMINIGLIIGVLSFIGATLTLPGIAGIVLTIGMAVDANVLIFERVREEMRQGRSPLNAIDTGYSRALGTILDANITTFIAATLLYGLGSGPIRGFAVTLGFGIVTSVFTAFTVTRLFVALWVGWKRPKSLPI
ncbi:MAG: protein translocase subunit SecD [Pseudomonadota bacterium]